MRTIGAVLGGAAGIALAPFTGGTSLLLTSAIAGGGAYIGGVSASLAMGDSLKSSVFESPILKDVKDVKDIREKNTQSTSLLNTPTSAVGKLASTALEMPKTTEDMQKEVATSVTEAEQRRRISIADSKNNSTNILAGSTSAYNSNTTLLKTKLGSGTILI